MRLDVYLVSKNFFESRNKATAAIKDGQFQVNGKVITKPSFDVAETDVLSVYKKKTTYVARSAHKLLTAFKTFQFDWNDKTVVDLGASTGGFCQVLLENGVQKIYAVDIGTAQLHPKLLNDPRIVNMEHTNARYLTSVDFNDVISAVTVDLSFISIKAIIPAIEKILGNRGEAVVLVKPQFEVGPQKLSKTGVVTNRKDQLSALTEIAAFAQNCGLGVQGIAFSGLTGESGNREYLLYLIKGVSTNLNIERAANAAVYMEDSDE